MNAISESETTIDDLQIISNPRSTILDEGQACASRCERKDAKIKKMKPERRQAADRVRELYVSGVPFFTKAAIGDLEGQLDRARKHYEQQSATEGDAHEQVFTLQGLDGKTVEIENEIGAAWPMDGTREEVMVNVMVDYQTYQHLIATTDSYSFDLKLAYCPLGANYIACERDGTTQEFFPQPRDQSLKSTQGAFDTGVNAWEDSEECKRITAVLMASTIPDKITKHVLILTIKHVLQSKNPAAYGEIRCYAQDPVYSDVDRTILEGAGIEILEDPHGFLEVDDSSVVISFSPNVPVRQIVADISRPAIMIWNKVKSEEVMLESWSKSWEERTFDSVEQLEGNITDPESSRLREMVQNEYVEIGALSEDAFGDSCVYVRRC